MKRKKVILVCVIVFICLFIFSIPTASSSALLAEPEPTAIVVQGVEDHIKQAIFEAIASNNNYIQGNMVTNLQVTDIQISKDQQWATAWVVYYDPQVEAVLPTEPALSVAHFLNDQWQVYLPLDPGWQNAITLIPDDLLSADEKDMWMAMNQGTVESFPTQSGYFLPWHGGLTGNVSRSVGHDADFTTAHYAFDFYFPGNTVCPSGAGLTSGPTGAGLTAGTTGANFSINASRAGTVWGWDDSVADCDHSKVNFIVLRNIDDPSLFQLYMHLSQDSIPLALKSVGTPVGRGQFIAQADNTGNSTGSHLHFQIEHQPTWPSANPYWNTALDMNFDDVDINGGRPRVIPLDPPYCRDNDICDVFRSTYISGNYYMGDSTPPIGELSGVTNGEIVTTEEITLNGWGSDGQTGLDYGQLKGYFDGAWHNLGPQFNPSISFTWDLCNPNMPVPNGPVSVEMLLYDIAGNPAPQVGLRHFTQNFACPIPPPACVPGPNQVALFEDAYFHGGCVKYGVGNYPTGSSLDSLGNNDAESILVGENTIATLYSLENFTGHSQAVTQNIGYMQYQWVSANTLSSMKVSSENAVPEAPILINPVESSVFREGDVIPFSWMNGGGATEFQVEIYLNTHLFQTLSWQADPIRSIDSLILGAYSWRVQAKNAAGVSAWSQVSTFSIESPIVMPLPETVPYSDTMETTQSKWVRSSSGYWSYLDNAGLAHSGTRSWWYQNSLGDYNDGHPNSGTLTSPPISITNSGYYLRFYYRYQTETQGITWDQRWLQISVDGGPFMNLIQAYDDPQIPESTSWMRNKAIDLSGYAGHIIRVRFQFSTFDADANNYPGWGIDDFSITATPPSACGENRQDETPDQAFLLIYDSSITVPGEICPNGDYDYYRFSGKAGDRIVADIDAMINSSPLDSYLYLIDTDGQTILAENDDEVYGQRRDPLIGYTLTKDGTYYLKLKAWKHPLVGGDSYFYTIRLYEDHVRPNATITWPSSNTYLPDAKMTVSANINDVNNGVNRVEFYWHPTNWISGVWEKLGTDWDGSIGWSMEFTSTNQIEGNNAAFFIQAYDMAGNWTGVGAWNLGIDKTAPTTSMKPLATTQPSNAFLLEWVGTDNLSGIDNVEIQEQINNGAWTTYPRIDGSNMQYWIIGIPGNRYVYKMRGIDHSGNTENYPAEAEATTTIQAANVLCNSLDSYDTSGDDNSPGKASVIYANGASQFHNFCNPLVPGFQNDEDWAQMMVVRGEHYLIHSIANSPPTATVISLYAQDGTSLLAESGPLKFGNNTFLIWTSDRDGLVYLRFRHVDGRVIGKNVASMISVHTGSLIFLPLINR